MIVRVLAAGPVTIDGRFVALYVCVLVRPFPFGRVMLLRIESL